MTYKQRFRYIDRLQEFADSYNSSKHRSIAMAPKDVTKENEVRLWHKLYWPPARNHINHPKFILEVVRLMYLRHAFHREYDQNWIGEIFKVSTK